MVDQHATSVAVLRQGIGQNLQARKGVEVETENHIGLTNCLQRTLGVEFETAEEYKLNFDTGDLDDRVKSKVETAIDRNLSVWLTGVEVALEEFGNMGSLPRNVLLCGGGASLSSLQEKLAISDWYKDLPFSRRPIIHLIDTGDLPNLKTDHLNAEGLSLLDHSFATSLGLLRVGIDTLAGAPEETGIRAKISKLLQK